MYTGGQSTRITDKMFIAIGTGYLFNVIPLPVVYMVILIAIFSFLLSKTKFGTYVYAIGGNREAARLSGVPIKKIEIIVFTLSGALAAFAGPVSYTHLDVYKRQMWHRIYSLLQSMLESKCMCLIILEITKQQMKYLVATK